MALLLSFDWDAAADWITAEFQHDSGAVAKVELPGAVLFAMHDELRDTLLFHAQCSAEKAGSGGVRVWVADPS